MHDKRALKAPAPSPLKARSLKKASSTSKTKPKSLETFDHVEVVEAIDGEAKRALHGEKEERLSPPLERQAKKYKRDHYHIRNSPGMVSNDQNRPQALSGLTVADPRILTPAKSHNEVDDSGLDVMEDLVVQASEIEPSRVLVALENAAAPLLETTAAMIASMETESKATKPVARMLQKTFTFFDIVIKAARTSAALYKDVHAKLREAEETLLQQNNNESPFHFTSQSQQQLAKHKLAFNQLLKVTQRALREERDHSNLLVVCYNSSPTDNAHINPSENLAAKDLLQKSAERLATIRSTYDLRVEALQKQLTSAHSISSDARASDVQSMQGGFGKNSGLDLGLMPWLSNLRGEQLQKALDEVSLLKNNLKDANEQILDLKEACADTIDENKSLQRQISFLGNKLHKSNNHESAKILKLEAQLKEKMILLKEAEVTSVDLSNENEALRSQLHLSQDIKLSSVELATLQHQLDEKKRAMDNLTKQYEEATKHNEQLRQKVVDAECKLKKANTSTESQENIMQELQDTKLLLAKTKLSYQEKFEEVKMLQAQLDEQEAKMNAKPESQMAFTPPLPPLSPRSTSPFLTEAPLELEKLKHAKEIAVERVEKLEKENTKKQAHIVELDCRVGSLRMKLSVAEKKSARKNDLIKKLESANAEYLATIKRLKDMVSDADRQRSRAVTDAANSQRKMEEAIKAAGPNLDELKSELENVKDQLSRVRAARQTLIEQGAVADEKLKSHDRIVAENNEMSTRLVQLENQAEARTKLISKLEKQLTLVRIRQHRSNEASISPRSSEKIVDDSYKNTPPRPGTMPYVLAGNGQLIHDFPPSAKSFNIRMSPRTSSPTVTDTKNLLASDLQKKLSSARNTIKILKERDLARVAEIAAMGPAEKERVKKYEEEISYMKDRLCRAENSLRKAKASKHTLEKKIQSLEEELVSNTKELAETKANAVKTVSLSKRASEVLLKKLTGARSAQNAAEYAKGATLDKHSHDASDKNNNIASSQYSEEEKTHNKNSKENTATLFLAKCLLSSLDKVKNGAKQNSYHGMNNSDLRGFSGSMTPKEFSRQLRTQLGVRLSLQELEIFLFYLDKNHDGLISFSEVIKLLRGPKARLSISKQEASEVVESFFQRLSKGEEACDNSRFSIRDTSGGHSRRIADDKNIISLESVEQLRLRLRQACTTFKGIKPDLVYNRWDRDGDGNISREEMRKGMEKLLGGDVLSEGKMFDHFFAYVDEDSSGCIERGEFCKFVMSKPRVRVVRRTGLN